MSIVVHLKTGQLNAEKSQKRSISLLDWSQGRGRSILLVFCTHVDGWQQLLVLRQPASCSIKLCFLEHSFVASGTAPCWSEKAAAVGLGTEETLLYWQQSWHLSGSDLSWSSRARDRHFTRDTEKRKMVGGIGMFVDLRPYALWVAGKAKTRF